MCFPVNAPTGSSLQKSGTDEATTQEREAEVSGNLNKLVEERPGIGATKRFNRCWKDGKSSATSKVPQVTTDHDSTDYMFHHVSWIDLSWWSHSQPEEFYGSIYIYPYGSQFSPQKKWVDWVWWATSAGDQSARGRCEAWLGAVESQIWGVTNGPTVRSGRWVKGGWMVFIVLIWCQKYDEL